MINNVPTYISLFSSAGVGCYGFKEVGFKCIATNELLERRLEVQKINDKCDFESGYINGDIKTQEVKEKIYTEIERWKNLGNDRVDVVIATPPCQGMSIANHKKNDGEIERNSLIVESVSIIKNIKPRFFIFENVSAFWKTGCVDLESNLIEIGEMILKNLGDNYIIYHETINFKNYGSNSSRPRTLVIGVDKIFSEDISPIELFPDYQEEKTLFEVIGNMPKLDWGEFNSEDFYHSFRIYPEHMREWIKDIKEGQSAFDNKEDLKKPHKIVEGKIVINQSKNGDKYTRQIFNKVAPCIHTRNDQLASQNTVHPVEDRVFSIRELMKLMTIPDSFKWLDIELEDLNHLSYDEKRKLSKKEELNIRQSIGEAVPTIIFQQIGKKIKEFLQTPILHEKEIKKLILEYNLENFENLKNYIEHNVNILNLSTLSRIIEYANIKRTTNSAYFTNKFIIQEIVEYLPDFEKDKISIIEPSVGAGNFLPFLFRKYAKKKEVNLKVIDIDERALELLKILYKDKVPKNFKLEFICKDYMEYSHEKVDLIIGNPPFSKVNGEYRKVLLERNINKDSTNLSEFMLEKAITLADYVSFIMPKNLLNTPEYIATRILLKEHVENIIDFGEQGFKGVKVETINIIINNQKIINKTQIISTTLKKRLIQNSKYIFDETLPYWIIYRDTFFDNVYNKMELGIFDVFRDRQITNEKIKSLKEKETDIRVIKSRNITDSGEIIDIVDYDSYIELKKLNELTIKNYLENTNVYLTPNMTYNPRMIKKEKGYVVNGSVAILLPKHEFELSKSQLDYIATDEYREFYRIARNYQTRSLNIDKTSCYWFGINKSL